MTGFVILAIGMTALLSAIFLPIMYRSFKEDE
jgi:hypothetical protein